jgi:putative transposase
MSGHFAIKRRINKPEEIIAKLRHVEVLTSQGRPAIGAIHSIGMTDAAYYFYGRLSRCG